MTTSRIPPGLAPAGGSLNFTNETVPEALQREHALGPGRWGVLHVFEGSLVYVDLESGRELPGPGPWPCDHPTGSPPPGRRRTGGELPRGLLPRTRYGFPNPDPRFVRRGGRAGQPGAVRGRR